MLDIGQLRKPQSRRADARASTRLAQIELAPGASSTSVTFAGQSGTLRLDQSQNFAGQVSGFGGADQIDLTDMAFGANMTLGYSANNDNIGGMLSVSDGTHIANIALLGSHMASTFVTASDGHGGTLITDPAQLSPPPLALPHA